MSASVPTFPHNLPLPANSFIGRGREIVEVKRLLGLTRLLTLTGPGGAGKTRLGLWVAAELAPTFAHGAALVELAPLSDPALASQTVAAALGLREQPGRSAQAQLTEHLLPRELLLVLDNCEHLVAACAQLAESLLRACPGLRLLATSREPLNIAGEVVWLVPSLSIPAPAEPAPQPAALLQSEAVRLFVERATAVSPGFQLTPRNAPAVAQVCRQLDGMPLAVELAAARVRALSVEQIASRLANHERFRLLTAGSRTAAPRQQTLEATLDWSHALLSGAERQVLRRLAVFAGGWTLEAAEAVCGDAGVLETLSHLVDKSLVVVDQAHGQARYHLLEVIRQYAHDKLAEAGETGPTRDRHLDYFVQWTELAEPGLTGPDILAWLRRYEAEHDNLRAALEWALALGATAPGASRSTAAGLRLAAACGRFWRLRGFISEGRQHLTATLALADTPEVRVRARALYCTALLAYLQSDYTAARRLLEDSMAAWHTLGPAGRAGVAEALSLLGEVATEEGDYATAPVLFEQSLALYRELGHTRGVADVLMQLGWSGLRTGAYDQAVPRLAESLALFRQSDDVTNIAFDLAGLGEAAVRLGDYDRAVPLLEESLALRRQHGDKWGMGASLGTLGWVALRQGDLPRLRAAIAESLALRLETGDKGGTAWCLEKLAEAAALLAAAAAALRAPVRSVIDPADQPKYDRLLASVRAALGEADFAAAWAEGSALSVEQAVAEALAEPEAPPAPAVGQDASSASADASARLGGLTAREREVAGLIAQGKSNREIAALLVVTLRTAETHISRILNKLGFTSRVQIAIWAVEQGLALPPATSLS